MNTQGDNVFRSWKAIANYFGKSERTVRRWESQEGLPVHRHQHQSAARIFAYQKELDTWFGSRSDSESNKPSEPVPSLCLALLPFEKLIDEPSRAFVADALCEDIVADLSYLPAVTMISYASSRRLVNSTEDLAAQLSSLNVHFYVEGSIRLAGETCRAHVRLIELTSQRVVWSARYNDTPPDWQRLGQMIVSELITSLPLSHTSVALAHSEHQRIHSQAAWEYLHKARAASLQWQPDAITRAIALLHAADTLVGGSALIQACLGRVYLQLRESGIDCSDAPVEKVSRILQALRKTHPKGFFTLSLQAWFDYINGKLSRAVRALTQALQANPNDPDALILIANCYLLAGQPELAKPYIRALQIVDPLTPLSRCMPGYYRLMTGDYRAAVAPYEEMLALDPSNDMARLFLVWVLAINGETTRVGDVCTGFQAQQKDTLITKLAFAFYAGLQGGSVDLVLLPQEKSSARVNGMLARFTAFAYAATGNSEEAVAWLAIAIDLGYFPYPYMAEHDTYFRPWHNESSVKKLLEKMKTKWRGFLDEI
ncbi:tetratricopeptide repeat protein [Alteromonas sp. H39]|uniref:tetratricopeptide repeat protein n=1 Tax=Alteromonas sp. H39 TaxID=3389876 RepID=UPI0039DFE7E3